MKKMIVFVALIWITMSLVMCGTFAEELENQHELPDKNVQKVIYYYAALDIIEHDYYPADIVWLWDYDIQFGTDSQYMMGEKSAYLIQFYDYHGNLIYRVLLDENGYTLARARMDNDYEEFYVQKEEESRLKTDVRYSNYVQISDFLNEEGKYIYRWSLEEKAQLGEEWQSIINREFSNEKEILYAFGDLSIFACRTFGVPADKHLTEEQAINCAVEVIRSMGESIDEVFYPVTFFDVTVDHIDGDSSAEWKLYLNGAYYITLNAETGECTQYVKRTHQNGCLINVLFE